MSSSIPLSSIDSKLGKDEDEPHNSKGLGWIVTALFVVGCLAGGGIVAIPTALIQATPYLGVAILLTMAAIVTFTSFIVGKSWNQLRDCWPEYREYTRKPYSEIGFRAVGPRMRVFVSLVNSCSQFMTGVVYLLLSSKNIKDAAKAFLDIDLTFCLVVLIVALCLLPFTFLRSPVDFWWVIVLAMLTTSGAVALILVGAARDYSTCSTHNSLPDLKPSNIFLALGTFLFSFCGHAAFPTIQHDMKTPTDFTKSTYLAFGITTLMYVVTGVAGFLAYGDSLRSSVINSVQTIAIQQAINLLITVHLLLTLVMAFNPVSQELEDLFRVPHTFCWQRVVVRTAVLATATFVAESVPSFGPLLDLVGGSTLTLSAIIFPSIFFFLLNARHEKMLETGEDHGPVTDIKEVIKYNRPWILLACAITVVLGFIGGGAATFSAIRQIISTKFEYPCYVSAFLDRETMAATTSTNCCGRFQNLTVFDSVTCSLPDTHFYK
ncbi:hypothetical protein PFISCL1PPCAC_17454 [Pristionchus fissidentatus]|uniref:Amino acid transporter transmembrane domain-containing protein n=1 Tax=Pristionchus fissidentatus TaxID=1538716 RepID=A0AAV5W7V1_9BILA|nr:hypothetical protein PFISCL1PPCAC_17454 [Pristionchus fissidentatus]